MGVAENARDKDLQWMRSIILNIFNKTLGRRGIDVRTSKIAQFWDKGLLEGLGPAECYVAALTLWLTKEVRIALAKGCTTTPKEMELTVPLMRTANPYEDPLWALAVWLEWAIRTNTIPLFHAMIADCEEYKANPRKTWSKWWQLNLIPSPRDNTTSISSSTHNKSTSAALAGAGINRSLGAVTHLDRTNFMTRMAQGGVSAPDASAHAGNMPREFSNFNRYTRAGIRVEPALSAAGWGKKTNGYKCALDENPAFLPKELCALVFPGLKDVIATASECLGSRWHTRDVCAGAVVKLIKHLRRVFIWNAASGLADEFPDLPAYRGHPLFSHPSWPAFKEAYQGRVLERKRVFAAAGESLTEDVVRQVIRVEVEAALSTHLKEIKELLSSHLSTVATMIGSSAPTPTPVPAPASAPTSVEPSSDPAPIIPKSYPNLKTLMKIYTTELVPFKDRFLGNPIPWKKLYGTDAKTAKQRYEKVIPLAKYVTAFQDEDRILAKLEKVITTLKLSHKNMTATKFVNNVFFLMRPRVSEERRQKEMCVPRAVVEAAFQSEGLPIPQ